jgi:GTP diphosphokinase / guanosine-3',5'-bis(diphosphate) 3'-diphosphatase
VPTIDDILKKVESYQPGADLAPIRAAHDYAAAAQAGHTRLSGAPALEHDLAVADLVVALRLDVPSICAALLHDVQEDLPDRAARLEARFGREVALIVEGVTKLQRYQFTSRLESQAENFKKMLVAMSKDIRVLMVKLCDRLHNMRDLEVVPPERRRETAEETLRIYSPLAERLGISWIRTELEDHAFRHLMPEEHAALKEAAEARLAERAGFIQEVIDTIRGVLQKTNLAGYEVFGRQKNLYGIHKKMKAQGIELDHVYDFVAFRIIVKEVPDCWQVLGHVHNLWTPIPSRFKDFVNVPKANGYRSLHTSVFGPRGEPMEVQIRTWEMHRVAESGIAAHWTYKEGGSVQMRDQERFNWLKQLIDWAQEVRSPDEFMENVQGSLFVEEVFAFTPKGDLRVLPLGATALDFAYDIHSEVGHACIGARVNSRLVPLSTPLRSGDLVEIMTSKTGRPKRDWLNFLKTSRATNKVKQFFQAEERAHAVEIGRQMLDKELKRAGSSFKRVQEDPESDRRLAGQFHASSFEDLVRLVGAQKVKALDVAEFLFPDVAKAPEPEPETPKDPGRLREIFKRRSEGIAVDGVEDMLLHLGKCCNPIPGDPITAFVTRGRGVTIHVRTCPAIGMTDPDRLLDAHWIRQQKGGVFDVPVACIAEDQAGVLAKITKEISELKANIGSIMTRDLGDGQGEVRLVLQVEDQPQLEGILKALRRIRGVTRVDRLRQADGLE